MRHERLPADVMYEDDGAPRHDNPKHAGAISHQKRGMSSLSDIYDCQLSSAKLDRWERRSVFPIIKPPRSASDL